jgi:hypothetical protein
MRIKIDLLDLCKIFGNEVSEPKGFETMIPKLKEFGLSHVDLRQYYKNEKGYLSIQIRLILDVVDEKMFFLSVIEHGIVWEPFE